MLSIPRCCPLPNYTFTVPSEECGLIIRIRNHLGPSKVRPRLSPATLTPRPAEQQAGLLAPFPLEGAPPPRPLLRQLQHPLLLPRPVRPHLLRRRSLPLRQRVHLRRRRRLRPGRRVRHLVSLLDLFLNNCLEFWDVLCSLRGISSRSSQYRREFSSDWEQVGGWPVGCRWFSEATRIKGMGMRIYCISSLVLRRFV